MYPNESEMVEIDLEWNDTSYQITNLTSGATYVVMVVAYKNNVQSQPAKLSMRTSMLL